jgi:hypothetical protein
MSHTNLNRRAILAGAAALPAVAVLPAAIAASAAAADNPDAERLRLGKQLEQVEQEFSAQTATDEKRDAVWEAACERAGLPRIDFGSIPHDEWMAYQDKRFGMRQEKGEVDEHGASVVWGNILDRLYRLVDEILPRKAVTAAGFAVRARAVAMAASELWDGDEHENKHEKLFIEAASALVGITPEPLRAAVARIAREAVQS